MSLQPLLIGSAFLLSVIGGFVLRVQCRAGSCPRHSRFAGGIAWGVGIICCAAGLGLMIWALML